NCGNILLALNPCKPIPIYDDKQHEFYDWRTFQTDPPAHVFNMGARVYRAMRESESNQVVLVCGESGAGKTETAKHLVKHFMCMCPDETGDLHQRIVEINPLLEAFGNAKTIMNDNSSRFAKYLELSFRSDGQVLGAIVRDYMLEKSRVVLQGKNEGNFHIFYSLFAGAPKSKLSELGLQKPETYRVLQSCGELLRDTAHYKEMYDHQMAVLHKIGLTQDEIDIVHCLLGAVLNITQIEFQEMDRSSGELNIRDMELLRVGETITSFKSLAQAEDGRDALAKTIYERTFGFIVRKINENLNPSKSRMLKAADIGILDIAGFEKLQMNSFEQMSINPRNGIFASLDEISKLQQGNDMMFVQKVMNNVRDKPLKHYLTFPKGERAEFCVKHFAGQVWYNCNGILEKNRDSLNQDLMSCLKASKDPFIEDLFTVKKGPTGTISATNFNIRKSKRAGGDIQRKRDNLLQQANLGKTLTDKVGKIGRATDIVYMPRDHKTVLSYTQKSMSELIQKMKYAEPYFIRCIKPNMELRPGRFDEHMVRDQLLYNGIVEIAKIRKMAFAIRKSHADFVKRYSMLCPSGIKILKPANITDAIVPSYFQQAYRIGKHKVFMKEELNTWLEKYLYVRQNSAARTITRGIRRKSEQKRRERLERERREKERQEKLERERREREQREKEKKEQEEKDESQRGNLGGTKRETLFNTTFQNKGYTPDSSESEEDSDAEPEFKSSFSVDRLRGTRGPKGLLTTSISSSTSTNTDDDTEHPGPSGVKIQMEDRPPTPPPPRTKEPEKKKQP
ncbi:hypothetical protein FSP39_022019, partial [Pinctada imbricata]